MNTTFSEKTAPEQLIAKDRPGDDGSFNHRAPDSVLMGLSGGVDSAMALYRLTQAGVKVCGATLLLQENPFLIPDKEHLDSAQDTCERLGVPFISLPAAPTFQKKIIGPFVDTYASGKTPSPCVFCNQFIKVPLLLEAAKKEGFSEIATGHYAQKECDAFKIWHIKRASDPEKDQSYFLSRLTSDMIEHLFFPLFDAEKTALVKEAKALGLKPAQSKESMDICFIKDQTYKELVRAVHPEAFEKGFFLSEAGERLGTHEGYANFTVGQRKGIGLAGGPWYVKRIDEKKNEVIIVKDAAPLTTTFQIEDVVLNADSTQLASDELSVQTHYRAKAPKAQVALHTQKAGVYQIETEEPVLAAPGQVAALYLGDLVLGSGIIQKNG